MMRGTASAALTTWLAAIAIALLVSASHLLDDISIPDHHAEWAQAQDIQLALNTAAARGRFEAAAQALCGPQAAWAELADGSVQCRTKYGKPTVTVRVSP